MTVEQRIKDMLFNAGLFGADLDEVMKRFKAQPHVQAVKFTDHESSYPTPLMATLWTSARRIGLEYIDETCPQAWFRSEFED